MNNTTSGQVNGTMVLYDLYSSTAKIVGYSVAYGLLFFIGIAGNIMVLVVVFINKSMRTTLNVLLVNLSFSDVVSILLTAPGFFLLEISNERWRLGLAMAIVSQLFVMLCAAVSVFTLMAIAFERYFAIVHPLKHRGRSKKDATVLIIVIIWLCSTAFALPFGIGAKLRTEPHYVQDNGETNLRDLCFLDGKMDKKMFRIYYMSAFIVLHVIPFLSLAIMYSRIAWKLWHPERQLSEQSVGNSGLTRMSEKNRRRTTLIVIAVLVAFFLCYFPFQIYFISELFQSGDKWKTTNVSSILRLVFLVNPAVNPIIYNVLSENFRAGFRAILCCLRKKSDEPAPSAVALNTIRTA